MTVSKMKIGFPLFTAAFLCCVSCVESNYQLGVNVVPIDQTYSIYHSESPLEEIFMDIPDSLSGYSKSRITIGAIRDEHFGLTTRGSAVTLVPMYDTLDFGINPVVKKFHFSASKDTSCLLYESQKHSLQNVKVYPLTQKLSSIGGDLNTPIPHGDQLICKGTPIIDGTDSLTFDFTKAYATKFLDITQKDLDSLSVYLDKFPGIYIETDKPLGFGGRINCFNLQLGWDSTNKYLNGSYASFTIQTKYDHWDKRKDTTFYFYFSPVGKYPIDSLLTYSSTGSFPQYCRNSTSHEATYLKGRAEETVFIEGGGGVKPKIKALELKRLAEKMISETGADPSVAVINKATLVLPFEFPDNYKDMDVYPYILSPTCRIMTDTSATFLGLTDSSDSNENQGDIDRSNLQFAPDITYHLQEILKIKETDTKKMEKLNNGSYDVWLLITANEVITTNSSSSEVEEMAEYYQYLAYQSYYGSMYGSSSSSYGDPYSNYYTYMMMAQMYSNTGSTTSTTQMLDKDRYYYGYLNGPAATGRKPVLKLTFSIPKG